MKQVVASVIDNREIFPPGISHSSARTILSNQLIWLSCLEITREAKPGQFVMVRCGEECLLPRPFSIHQINKRGDMALFFTVWEDGKGTRWLSQRHKGDRVELFGPLGNGFSIQPNSHNLLLVAGGIGIAPLYFLAQEALKKKGSVTLLYGTTDVHRYPQSLLPSGLNLVAATEDGSIGYKGLITNLLPHFLDRADQIFVCGPTPLYRDLALRKQELKLEGKPAQISLEVRMGCGRGVCYGCTVKTKSGLTKVCQDGPVFDLDDIVWDELGL